MFENGCFLRRQKRFRCPRKEILRQNSRTSTTSGSTVDGTASDGVQTAEDEIPSGQSATSIKRGGKDDRKDVRKPSVPDDVKPAPDLLSPLPRAVSVDGDSASLLQTIASVGDYGKTCSAVLPLTEVSGDVVQHQGYGSRLMYQQHQQPTYPYCSNLAFCQPQQPHVDVTASSGLGCSTLFPRPEVLTSTTAFPVYSGLQRYRVGGIQQHRINEDQLQAAMSYQLSSQQFYTAPEVYRQLLQPSSLRHLHPASDGDPVPTMADDSTSSLSRYHTRYDVTRSEHLRSLSSGSGHQ